MDLPKLGMITIKAEHSVPGFDWLFEGLEERRSTIFDISASLEDDVVEEIDLADYIQAMLIDPLLEPSAIVLIEPVQEFSLTPNVGYAAISYHW